MANQPIPAPDMGGWRSNGGSSRGGWFDGIFENWIPEFSWGENPEGNYPPPGPPAPPSGRAPSWEQTGRGNGMATAQPSPQIAPPPRNSPEGGGGFEPADTGMPEVVNEYTPPQKYAFLDAPGASDSLVAFGAAMLKAPDFNTGLGDAALAVNKVAQSYRQPSEADYARAKQLGVLERIKSGKATTQAGASINRDILYRDAEGNTWFDATGPNGEAGLFNQETGQFTTQGVPGLTRDVYDFGSNRSRRSATKDADIEKDLDSKLPAIAANVVQFNELYKLAADDSTGIDSTFTSRVTRELERLLPGQGFGGMDANNITEFNNRIQKAALDYASGAFKGQGQVTENERAMIERAVGQPGTLTKKAAMEVFKVMRDAEMRKLTMMRNWKRDPALREQYDGSFTSYQADVLMDTTMQQMQDTPSSAPPTNTPPAPSGTTKSGVGWKID